MTIMRPIIFVIKPFLENKASRFIETLGVNNIALFGGTLEPQSSHIFCWFSVKSVFVARAGTVKDRPPLPRCGSLVGATRRAPSCLIRKSKVGL